MLEELRGIVRDFMDKREIAKMSSVERERIQKTTQSALSDPDHALSLAGRILRMRESIGLYVKLSKDSERFRRVMEEAVRLQRKINRVVKENFSKMFVPEDQRQPPTFYQCAERQVAQVFKDARQQLTILMESLAQESEPGLSGARSTGEGGRE